MMRKAVYSIFFTRTSEKQYFLLSSKVRREVALILEDIARDPLIGKPLQGALKGLRATRIGKFRVIYQQKKNELIVLIINIGHRKNIYRNKK